MAQFAEVGEYRLEKTETHAMEILSLGDVRLIRPLAQGDQESWIAGIQGDKGCRFVKTPTGSHRRFHNPAVALRAALELQAQK